MYLEYFLNLKFLFFKKYMNDDKVIEKKISGISSIQ